MKVTFPPNFVWNNYTFGKWEQKETFCQKSLMHLFNGDRPIVQCGKFSTLKQKLSNTQCKLHKWVGSKLWHLLLTFYSKAPQSTHIYSFIMRRKIRKDCYSFVLYTSTVALEHQKRSGGHCLIFHSILGFLTLRRLETPR